MPVTQEVSGNRIADVVGRQREPVDPQPDLPRFQRLETDADQAGANDVVACNLELNLALGHDPAALARDAAAGPARPRRSRR